MSRSRFIGLHLWTVVVGSDIRATTTTLLILTRTNSPDTAARKARKVIKRDGYRGKIEKIEHSGTIDA